MSDSDSKYVTFNRDELMEQMSGLPVIPLFARIEIQDAVVIRRQDKFASAALAGYANSLAIVISLTEDPKLKSELLDVADYFQRQSELAADEGFKTPTV